MPYSPPDPTPTIDNYNEYELHVNKLLHAHLIEFDLPTRILFPLCDHGICRLGDLTSSTPRELSKIPNIGAKAIEHLSFFLRYHRLDFGMKKG